MKEFRKNDQGLFICEECERIFAYRQGIRIHITRMHNSKEYHDMWLKENDDNLCKICKKETQFKGLLQGYKNTCSYKCNNIYAFNNREIVLIQKYGVKNVYQSEEIKKKIKETNIKKYRVEYPMQCNEIKIKSKEKCLIKWGVDNVSKNKNIYNKIKQTKKERYGNENYNNTEKTKKTCKKRYGVEYVSQNVDIFEKQQKTKFLRKKFRDTNIWYQGSYELDFLEKYYDKFTDIQRAPTIKYIFKDRNKVYFPDFLIPSLNLIIECKNSYLVKRYKENIKVKKKAVIAARFKYIIIIDKNYKKFNKLFLPTF